jgi:dienelactone hydrolase
MFSLRASCRIGLVILLTAILSNSEWAIAQNQANGQKDQQAAPEPPSAEILQALAATRDELRKSVEDLKSKPELSTRDGAALLADVAVFEKAATWMLRYQEFPKSDYLDQLKAVLAKGKTRAEQLANGQPDWVLKTGITIRGYVSKVDGSVQPYALTLPAGVNPNEGRRWPLHVVLHGRADQMNEVNFIHRIDGKPLKADAGQPEQNWIQLDVYGRGNNAYRFAGETDVFDAMDDVKRRFRIDEDRITLHGFSMGGAGAWHLGLHYPSMWSSVGPGAGFVDFYRYQKQDPENPEQRRPDPQHATLAIYDSVNYAMNAFNVPVCTYGGENDPQLLASTSMAEAAEVLDVPIKVIVGPKMGHAFDPESQKQFMAFHLEQSAKGRPRFGQRREIRFSTHTLKYNECDWLAIEEVENVYDPSAVEAKINDAGDVEVTTSNVMALRIVRDVSTNAVIDGTTLECRQAADGLLPEVYYVKGGAGWEVLSYDDSRSFADNRELRKRPDLQGPIDDAFMSSFLCVRGTSTPWSETAEDWSKWTLSRFEREFSQWMRGDVRVVDDTAVTEDMIAKNHLVLFGDPGSNAIYKRVLEQLPVEWTEETIKVGDQEWSAKDHGLSLIFPNPLNRSKYIVLNSGHTFHDKDFRSSNAWLFPRLGDIAVQKITPQKDGSFQEETVWSDVFGERWQLR